MIENVWEKLLVCGWLLLSCEKIEFNLLKLIFLFILVFLFIFWIIVVVMDLRFWFIWIGFIYLVVYKFFGLLCD